MKKIGLVVIIIMLGIYTFHSNKKTLDLPDASKVEFRTQAADHPILWNGDENSYYLKFYIFQVVDEK